METLQPKGESERFGKLVVNYEFVAREAGGLATGELVREPYLGPARVADITVPEPGSPYVQVGWKDDHGSSTAAARYPADQTFLVRVPALGNRLAIEQAVHRAERINRDIAPNLARLIAAQLHQGPRSMLYRFARDGAVREALFEELDSISRHQPDYRPWVNALARYALSREAHWPVPGWEADERPGKRSFLGAKRSTGRRQVTTTQTVAKPTIPAVACDTKDQSAKGVNGHDHGVDLMESVSATNVDAETAQRLVEAAFTLGLEAASRTGAARARRIIKLWEQRQGSINEAELG